MIAAHHKFPLRTEFTRFRSRASRLPTPHTVIYHLQTASSTSMAVVIPKKVNKLATTRNWLKRLTYAAAWPLLQNRQLDCVIVYKPLPLQKSLSVKMELINELSQTIGNL